MDERKEKSPRNFTRSSPISTHFPVTSQNTHNVTHGKIDSASLGPINIISPTFIETSDSNGAESHHNDKEAPNFFPSLVCLLRTVLLHPAQFAALSRIHINDKFPSLALFLSHRIWNSYAKKRDDTYFPLWNFVVSHLRYTYVSYSLVASDSFYRYGASTIGGGFMH